MASCTKIRQKTPRTTPKSGTWADTFPKQITNQQESVRFVKKLLAVAISNIAYLRVIFPERAFGDRCVEDLQLKILRNESSCQGAAQVIEWLKGVFDAIDKKYLRLMTLGIYQNPDDPNTLVEAYSFRFAYNESTSMEIYRDDKKISSTKSIDQTKKETIQMLHTLIVLVQTLKPLPEKFNVTMKLLYYDNVTPQDYEPPGFKPGDNEHFAFDDQTMKIRIGDVGTMPREEDLVQDPSLTETVIAPQHKQQTVVATGLDHEDDEESMIVAVNFDANVAENSGASVSGTEKMVSQTQSNKASPQFSKATNGSEVDEIGGGDTSLAQLVIPESEDRDLGATNARSENSGLGVRCCCGCSEDDGLMILCSSCNYWQHGVCFAVLKIENAPLCHICTECAMLAGASAIQISGRIPTDPSLLNLSVADLLMTCQWRRLLKACDDIELDLLPLSLSVRAISDRLVISKRLAFALFKKLHAVGLLEMDDGGLSNGIPRASRSGVVDVEKIRHIGLKTLMVPIHVDGEVARPSPQQSEIMEISTQASRMDLSGTANNDIVSATSSQRRDSFSIANRKTAMSNAKDEEETREESINKSKTTKKSTSRGCPSKTTAPPVISQMSVHASLETSASSMDLHLATATDFVAPKKGTKQPLKRQAQQEQQKLKRQQEEEQLVKNQQEAQQHQLELQRQLQLKQLQKQQQMELQKQQLELQKQQLDGVKVIGKSTKRSKAAKDRVLQTLQDNTQSSANDFDLGARRFPKRCKSSVVMSDLES